MAEYAAADISALELENLHLKEALAYAKRGWEDALLLLQKEEQGIHVQQSLQAKLEIDSLQMELQAVHKRMLVGTQAADEFKDKLLKAAEALESQTEEIRSFVGCPLPVQPDDGVEELSYGIEDREDVLNGYLQRVTKATGLLRDVGDFIKTSSAPHENGEAKPHLHATKKHGTVKKKKAATSSSTAKAHH